MIRVVLVLVPLLFTGCATTIQPAATADQFFARLSSLCGKAFEGKIASPASPADRDFAGKRLVLHVRECSADTIRIPFHVDENRSRTFVITRTSDALRLKHDHRHEDGSAERVTQYGGDTTAPGTISRQDFPADQFSRELFMREKRPAAADNIWSWEIEPRRLFAFELRRPERLLLRVDFDLSRPVPIPPPPWGSR